MPGSNEVEAGITPHLERRYFEPIEIPRPIMMHDFAITQDYVLFFDLPLVFSFEGVARGGMPYAFEASAGARIGILRRDAPTAPVRWLEIEPCYFFHPVNAWNEGTHIRLDVARYPDLWRERTDRFGTAALHRFDLDLAKGSVRSEALDDLGIEFPRIREDRCGLRTRFGYAATTRDDGVVVGTGLVRYDLETGERERFDGGGLTMPSEAVFVPASVQAGEGEGWLLAYLHDPGCGPSELAIFDATKLSKGPIARAKLPQRIPLGFHGSWVDDADL